MRWFVLRRLALAPLVLLGMTCITFFVSQLIPIDPVAAYLGGRGAAQSDAAEQAIIDALNALPRVALIPLFILWFGIGTEQKVASGVSIMYFVLLSYTMAGAKSTDPDHLRLARSLAIPGWRTFLEIIVPSALPAIFAGLRLGMIYTVLGVITAELIAGGKGLGTLVSYYSNTFNPNGVFATLIALVLITIALTATMSRIERSIAKWHAPIAV